MPSATMKGVPSASLAGFVGGTGTAFAIPITSHNPQFEVIGTGTITGGTIILEENISDPAYSGTWSQLASITASTLTGGASQVYHIMGNCRFVRARISSNITGGGTVTVNVMSD